VLVFVFGGQFIGAIPYFILLGFKLMPSGATPMASVLSMLIFFVLTFTPTGFLLWLWLILYERRGLKTLGLERPIWLWKFARGLLIGTGLFGFLTAVLALAGFLQSGSPGALVSFPALIPVLLALMAWTLQGSLEEIVMRGWLMPVLSVRYRPWLGVLVSSVLFALLHLLNPNVSFLSVLNIALAGLLFSLFALWEGGLWGACGLHAAWNWAQGSLFGFPVSGNLITGPALFNLTENGPDLLTGGAFGPEGGLLNTLVSLAACGMLVFFILRKQKAHTAHSDVE
jgi:membrane protease YdiL (CAAX protease family)